MYKTNNMRRRDIRWRLLASASAAALFSAAFGTSEAQAADADRPSIWIELGGQLNKLDNQEEQFSPSFLSSITQSDLLSALDVQHSPTYAIDEEGAISFQPEDSDWVFSASIRYGRSQSAHSKHQQTPNALVQVHSKIPFPAPVPTLYPGKYAVNTGYAFYPNGHVKFADGTASKRERHAILDFQAGNDVGLGMFGSHGSSVLSAGVRIAQFTSKTNVNLRAEPDVNYPTAPIDTFFQLRQFKYYNPQRLHDYAGEMNAQRSFRGIGPSLSWNASTSIAGDLDHGEIALDWGVNGAVLFGRQKARGHHQTTTRAYYGTHFHEGGLAIFGQNEKRGRFFPSFQNSGYNGLTQYNRIPADFSRTRSVTVPNLGGFAGISYRYADAKISIGYRADFFFGAMDGGIDTRKSENRAFYGPYASISIGLGD